jgi:hypothetical protein
MKTGLREKQAPPLETEAAHDYSELQGQTARIGR